jgi:RNA polymerase sigma-54 factor
LSDQALADHLADSGIKLARRTVAKYREQLGIPGSAQRRRAARLQAG